MKESNRIRIEAGMSTASTRVTVGDTGQRIEGIKKIELTAEPGGVWIAVLHVYPSKVNIEALAKLQTDDRLECQPQA